MHVKLSGVVVQDFEEGVPRQMRLRNIMQRQTGEDGFTLIELIIVMAILAFLVGLAVPKFNGILSESKEKAHQANISLIQQAAELYYYQTSSVKTETTINNDEHYLVAGGYLKEAPTNPLTDAKDYTVIIGDGGKIEVNKSLTGEN